MAVQLDLGLELVPELVAHVRLHLAAQQLHLLDPSGQLLLRSFNPPDLVQQTVRIRCNLT